MRKTSIEISLGMLGFSMFPALNLRSGTNECLHAHLALHSLSIVPEIKPFQQPVTTPATETGTKVITNVNGFNNLSIKEHTPNTHFFINTHSC